MHRLVIACTLLVVSSIAPAAGDYGDYEYRFTLNLERSALEGRTFGDDRQQDRLVVEEYQLELALEYAARDDLYLFFVGTLIDDSATLQTSGNGERERGLEINQLGVGYLFGERPAFELNAGRLEFVSASDWWIWWDEELDAVRLQATRGSLGAMLAIAEQLAADSTGQDEIPAENDGLRRGFLTLAWNLSAGQSMILYYLEQDDRSASFGIGDTLNPERVDEEDADLRWFGISYLAEFDLDAGGEISLELHAARVEGDETVYEFDESGGMAEVGDIQRRDVDGTALGLWFDWRPRRFDEWRLILGHATGSGDADAGDGRDGSFRQNGLQGDSESFGELYQPELSNLDIDIVGIAWEFSPGVELALLGYHYQQRELAAEMRDVGIAIDPNGESRDLGREVDLLLTVSARPGMELILTLAEFDPGEAYGDLSDETSNFVKFELDYEF